MNNLPLSIKLIAGGVVLTGIFWFFLFQSCISDAPCGSNTFFKYSYIFLLTLLPGLILAFGLLKKNKIAWIMVFLANIILGFFMALPSLVEAIWGQVAPEVPGYPIDLYQVGLFLMFVVFSFFLVWKLWQHRKLYGI